MPRFKNETTIQLRGNTPHLRGNTPHPRGNTPLLSGDTPRPSRLQPLAILLTAFALLAAGCSSSESESANTEAASLNSTAENSTSETTTPTEATTATKGTGLDDPCISVLLREFDASPIDFVKEAIACDPEAFRSAMIYPLAEPLTSLVVDGFGLDSDSATRFEECAGRVLKALSQSELISLAEGSETAEDYGAAIGAEMTDNCLSSVGTLDGLTDDEILDAVVARTADELLWERTGPIRWNSNWISRAETDDIAIVVILEQHTRLALVTSIGFEPAVEHSTAAMALNAFLDALGVEASPALIDQILDGTALPSSETIRFCVQRDGGALAVMASTLAMSCFDGL